LSSPAAILGSTTLNAELAEHASFDRLRMSAHGELFDSSLTLSLSKGERLAQDMLVEPCGLGGLCVDRRPYAEAL